MIFFGIVYSSVSLVNHILFRTYALDLGMFNQALHSFSRFRQAIFTLDIEGGELTYFATHFSPISFLYVPFYYLFGSYTLLIIQILAILGGGYGIFRYSLISTGNRTLSHIVMIFFFGIWGIYSALSFDFHNNVVGAMLLPWFIYFLRRGKRWSCLIIFSLILMCQENMALWMVFITAGLLFLPGFKGKRERIFIASLLISSFIWFIIVMQIIGPALNPDRANQLSRYSHLGGSLPAIVLNIVGHPLQTARLLFANILEDEIYSGIKRELHLMVLLSGGIALIFRPQYLIMLIPVYAQKLFANDYALWGINYQYSIEFAPVLALAMVDTLSLIRKPVLKLAIMIMVTLVTYISTFSVTESRISKWYTRVNARFYSAEHYRTNIDIISVRRAIRLVPDNVPVSVNSELAPHLARRQKLYHFPIIKDAEYILLLQGNRSTYPLTEKEYREMITELRNSSEYLIENDDPDILILKVRKD